MEDPSLKREKMINELQYISLILSNISSLHINPLSSHYIFSDINICYINNNIKQLLRNLHFISKHSTLKYKQSFISTFPSSSITLLIIQCLLYDIEHNTSNTDFPCLQHLISKLHDERLLTVDECLTIIKFCVITSIRPRSSITTIRDGVLEWENKRITRINIIHKVINLLLYIDIPTVTEEFCRFIIDNVLKNKTNYYLIIKSTKILSMLYLHDTDDNVDDSIIVKFLCKLYMFNYDKDILEIFISKISSLFYNNNNRCVDVVKVYNVIKRNILLLSEIMKIEEKNENVDSFMLNRGYVFENNQTGKNGITVSNIANNEGKLSIIFSFNFNSKNIDPQYTYTLIALESTHKQHNECMFYIKDSHLHVEYFNNDSKRLCSITPGSNYIVFVSYSIDSPLQIQIKSQKDFNGYIIEQSLTTPLSNELILHIGKYSSKIFEGYIGPVIMFKDVFTDEFKSFTFALKGSYEKMLYCKSYSTSQIDKYEPSKNNLVDDITYCNEDFNKALVYFTKHLDHHKLIAVVYPLYEGVDFSKEKVIYTNSDFIETKMIFESIPCLNVGDCFCFEHRHIIFEFLKYEGFNFVIFNYEVLTSNVSKAQCNDESFNILMNTLKKLMEFTMEFFVTVNIVYYVQEMRMLLFSLKKCILKVSYVYVYVYLI